jgi:hypothetical protein
VNIQVIRVGGGPIKLSSFAERYGLTLVVHERPLSLCPPLSRFYAHFEGVDESDGHILRGLSGSGDTAQAAIVDYASWLAGKHLVHNAFKQDRREFDAPNAWIPEEFDV